MAAKNEDPLENNRPPSTRAGFLDS